MRSRRSWFSPPSGWQRRSSRQPDSRSSVWARSPHCRVGFDARSERNNVFTAPHLVFFPGLAIMITVLGFNLMGDGLRDALDPTLNR